MSRSGYTDDGESVGLWRGAVRRSIRGQRGQTLLREMVIAFDAMPVKELASEVFVDGDRMCAMGAVAVARGVPTETLARLDEYDPDDVGTLLNIPRVLAAEIAYENDEWARGDDEDRWQHMRDWAVSNIIERKPTPTGPCSWCCKTFTLNRGTVAMHKWHGERCPGVRKAPREAAP
jgi:hypothetical protein